MRYLCWSMVVVWMVTWVTLATVLVQAQQPPLSCDDKLALLEKQLLVVRDDRERWQQQLAAVWVRAEKAEAALAQAQHQLTAARTAVPEPPKEP
jgi:hypothetical protein